MNAISSNPEAYLNFRYPTIWGGSCWGLMLKGHLSADVSSRKDGEAVDKPPHGESSASMFVETP